jgi:hypothetical protein
VDVPAGDDSELSVEYVERSYAKWQIETDIILFGTPEQIARPEHNGSDN